SPDAAAQGLDASFRGRGHPHDGHPCPGRRPRRLLVINISTAVLVLLAVIFLHDSMDLSVFPSLLLVTTLCASPHVSRPRICYEAVAVVIAAAYRRRRRGIA
ncbi:FHIPEP family type III secretion protein, partial [Streptococcus pneumoniae]|uniref:FHIPEP family type III secretion protein n=1 Tax=Streptococcus pneumoniae TaxID=1313 RepID=UPI00122F7094